METTVAALELLLAVGTSEVGCGDGSWVVRGVWRLRADRGKDCRVRGRARGAAARESVGMGKRSGV